VTPTQYYLKKSEFYIIRDVGALYVWENKSGWKMPIRRLLVDFSETFNKERGVKNAPSKTLRGQKKAASGGGQKPVLVWINKRLGWGVILVGGLKGREWVRP